MKKLTFVLSVLLSIFMLDLHAQQGKIRFDKISIEQGLSQSSVISICQDHWGFLWFGTYEGLNRYDGYQFKIYKNDPIDSASLSNNVIKVIYEDHLNILWVGTEGGLNRFDPEKERFIRYLSDKDDSTSLSNDRVRNIFEDRFGVLWIATDHGLNRFNREKDNFKIYYHEESNPNSISHNFVREMYEDHLGNLWIGTDVGLNLFDREKERFIRFFHDPQDPYSLSGNNILSFGEDAQGDLWIGTWDEGLNRFDQEKKRFIRYRFDLKDPYSLRHNIVRSIYGDRSGELWIATYGGGLEKYDRAHDRFIHYQHDANDPYSLSSNAVYCIYEDRSGILWFGTDFGGVSKFDRKKNQFAHFQNDPNDPYSLNNNTVNAFYEDPDDQGKIIWIGTWGGGLCKFDRKKEIFTHFQNDPLNPYSLSNDVIRCIFEDHTGILWIGTDGGLNRFDRRTGQFLNYQCIPGNPNTLDYDNIYSICEDHTNRLWIGSYYGGLNRFDQKTGRFIRYRIDPDDPASFNDNIVWFIYEDRSEQLWIGTDAGGLNRYDSGRDRFTHYMKNPDDSNSISDNKVLCIFEDHSGILWLGTPNGLNRFDAVNERFHCYDEKNGLASSTIQAILEDDDGYLWISTVSGLSRFDPRTEEFVNYDVNNGLQGNEFNVNACFKSVTGEMFFGGVNGFNLFFPQKIKTNQYVPPIVLTDFQLFNRSVYIGQKIDGHQFLEKSILETSEIRLTYKEDVFSIEFASLDYTAPDKNKYAYFMEGIEKDWNYVGNRRFATYTKLRPGTYKFRVKGSNNDGVWNNEDIALKIKITPPFWYTIWFRMFIILLILGVLLAGFQMRITGIRNRNRELEHRVTERTAELEETNKELEAFAYSVSHDLRAPLRGMDGFSKILIEDYNEKIDEKGKDYLLRIRKASHRMSQLIDDLLRLFRLSRGEMSFDEVNLSELFQSVIDEYKQADPDRQVEVKIDKDIYIVGDRSLLKVMFQNLVDNAWKFSRNEAKAEIAFGIKKQNEETVFYVKDNGIGFNMAHSQKMFEPFQRQHSGFEGTGVGLATVKRIVQRHGGRIWAEGRENDGATFYFTLGK